ncbi:MAG TPA: hypothetical protein VK358_08580 [Longimicrobium sp.]|nr:hypothetical protein [Longimicrobium sp.]
MANTSVTSFGRLSAVLTGFPLERVAPALDPIGLPAQFLAWVTDRMGQPAVQQLLAVYDGIDQQTGGNLAQQGPPVQAKILADATLGPLARRIMRLWYLGTWYDTEPPAGPFPTGQVVSMNAYTGGLAWDAMQAHPMGYSEMHYGYWSDVPAPVQTLTTTPGA